MKVISYKLELEGSATVTDKSLSDKQLVDTTKTFVATDILSMAAEELEKLITVEIKEIQE